MRAIVLATLSILALAACRDDESASLPQPVAMTEEALGHYCQMNLAEHPGPKAQVHLDGMGTPIYFAQVRDAIAYQRMPEQSSVISVVYVNDMGAAPSWEQPGIDNWIPASTAFYVAGSDILGGMGAPEFVPFSKRAAAEEFVGEHGGRILPLSEIKDAEVLSPVEKGTEPEEETDFKKRLKELSQEGRG
jgi:copper chaperone NosL